jgi:hypothetical protein
MHSMGNTTPSDGAIPADNPVSANDWVDAVRARQRSRRIAPLAGLLSLIILGLALPRLVGEVMVLEARQVVLDLRTDLDSAGEPARLLDAAAAIEAAGSLTGDGRLVADQGLLLMQTAVRAADAETRRRLLLAAASASETGLRLAPAYPAAWTRLAFIRRELGDPAAAATALRMSMLTGAVMPQVMTSRLALGLELRPWFDPEGLRLLARQVRLVQEIRPDSLAGLSRSPTTDAFITATLRDMQRPVAGKP